MQLQLRIYAPKMPIVSLKSESRPYTIRSSLNEIYGKANDYTFIFNRA